MQLCFDFALQMEECPERSKKPHPTNRSNKLVYLVRRPSGELATFDDVFGHFTEVILSSGVFNFDDAELLSDKLTPRDSQHTSVKESDVA